MQRSTCFSARILAISAFLFLPFLKTPSAQIKSVTAKRQTSIRDVIDALVLQQTYSDSDPSPPTSIRIQPFYSQRFNPLGVFDKSYQKQTEKQPHHDSWMNSGKYQGDIAGVTRTSGMSLTSSDPSKQKYLNAVRDRKLRWANGIVPYLIDPGFNPEQIKIINGALQKYHRDTCIRFVPRTYEADYLYIIKDYGCYSLVGRTGGKQELSLGRGCVFHEIIVHEIMHSLGFWHEQSRADRDTFIDVVWHNIIPGLHGQFDKIDYVYSDFLGEPYDYYSVMHYDSTAFSKNGLNTLEARAPGMTNVIGKALDLSVGDLRKINKLYSCPNHPAGNVLPPIVATPVPTPSPTTAKPATTTVPYIFPTLPTPAPFIVYPPPLLTIAPYEPPTPSPPVVPSFSPYEERFTTSVPAPLTGCVDKFLDCPFFNRYCYRQSFYHVMQQYCPRTCAHCSDSAWSGVQAPNVASTVNPWEKDLLINSKSIGVSSTHELGKGGSSWKSVIPKPSQEFRARPRTAFMGRWNR